MYFTRFINYEFCVIIRLTYPSLSHSPCWLNILYNNFSWYNIIDECEIKRYLFLREYSNWLIIDHFFFPKGSLGHYKRGLFGLWKILFQYIIQALLLSYLQPSDIFKVIKLKKGLYFIIFSFISLFQLYTLFTTLSQAYIHLYHFLFHYIRASNSKVWPDGFKS